MFWGSLALLACGWRRCRRLLDSIHLGLFQESVQLFFRAGTIGPCSFRRGRHDTKRLISDSATIAAKIAASVTTTTVTTTATETATETTMTTNF